MSLAAQPMITEITDPQDPRLDDVRDLKHSDNRPDLPGGKGLVIAEGPLVISRLFTSRFPVRCLVGFAPKLEKFLADPAMAQACADIPIYAVTREVLAAVAGYDMHRGLLAAADRAPEPPVAQILDTARTIFILEGVGDHENIGSLFRNGAGMDVDGVLFGNGCADPLYRRSVRVSMGHVLRMPFATLPGKRFEWQQHLETVRQAGFHLVSLTPNPQAPLLAEALYDASGNPLEKVAFLVGAEGPGLLEKTMRLSDVRARIPMAAGTDSLNLATAAAIACYERSRGLTRP